MRPDLEAMRKAAAEARKEVLATAGKPGTTRFTHNGSEIAISIPGVTDRRPVGSKKAG